MKTSTRASSLRQVLVVAIVLGLVVLASVVVFYGSGGKGTSSKNTTSGGNSSSGSSNTGTGGNSTSSNNTTSGGNSTSSNNTTSSGNSTTPGGGADYQFFIQSNLGRIEKLREWFMSPFNLADEKSGYDPNFGMIRGGYWGGGFQNGFVLIDTQLILAKSLDYFNAQAGVHTDIEGKLRAWLNSTFVDPSTGMTGTYNGDDRREIMFGTVLNCVNEDSGQVYYVQGHTLSDADPITTALPVACSESTGGAMNTYALWIELYYLKGDLQTATSMFMNTIGAWTPTPGTGIGGSTGGYFSGSLDQGTCKSSRSLGYWLEMARATGFWNTNSQTKEVALEAMDELWAHQSSDGGILVSYPNCGGAKESGESSGLALIAFDPRVPSWFDPQAVQPMSTSDQATSQNMPSYGSLASLTAAVSVVNVAGREDGPAEERI